MCACGVLVRVESSGCIAGCGERRLSPFLSSSRCSPSANHLDGGTRVCGLVRPAPVQLVMKRKNNDTVHETVMMVNEGDGDAVGMWVIAPPVY